MGLAMSTPADRVLVGDYGSGQALADDQWRMLRLLIPPARSGGRPRTAVVRGSEAWAQQPPPCPGSGGADVGGAYRAAPSFAGCLMPCKANEPRRHKIPKARYRVQN